jgi:ankyrin repeat protein
MKRNAAALRALLQQKADVNAPQSDGSTALHWAVHFDDVAMVEMLIGAGANVKAANRLGVTPLSLACQNGNAVVVERLVKAGADPNAALTELGDTPLMMAARTGNVDTVRVLLDSGANVNAKESSKSQTALMWAASEGHAGAVKLLVDRGAEVNARSKIVAAAARGGPGGGGGGGAGARGANRGAAAAGQQAPAAGQAPAGQIPPVPARGQQTPAAAAAPPPAPGTGTAGVTSLMLAAREGRLDAVKVLVDAKADVNMQSGNGSTALLMAILNGNYQVAAFLLDHGANPNIADRDGKAALYALVEMRNLDTTDTPGPAADKNEALELTQAVLQLGADVNARLTAKPPFRGGLNRNWFPEPGATPFYRAAAAGDVRMMRILLAYGADPYIPSLDNTTPLMVASGVGYLVGSSYSWPESEALEAVKLAMKLGDVNAVNNAGLTALHGAAFRGWNAAVRTLVDGGAKMNTKDKQGRTPVDWADAFYRGGGIAPVRQVQTLALFEQLLKKN